MASRHHPVAALALAAAMLLPLSSLAASPASAQPVQLEQPALAAASAMGHHASALPASPFARSSFNPYATDSPIYHDSEQWQWLSYSGKVIPGGHIFNATTGGQCSTGWIVGQNRRSFILTAGHCGRVYDRFGIRDRNGNTALIGQMVEKKDFSTGQDYGLIEITNPRLVDPRLPNHYEVTGWRTVQWLNQQRPTICHLGYRTGKSCGQYLGVDDNGYIHFRGIVDHGDSGGPVFAVVNNTIYAVGVISWSQPSNATDVAAQPIEPAMVRWGLTLYVRY